VTEQLAQSVYHNGVCKQVAWMCKYSSVPHCLRAGPHCIPTPSDTQNKLGVVLHAKKRKEEKSLQDKPHRVSSQKHKPRVLQHCLPTFCVSPTPEHFPVAVWVPCIDLLPWTTACPCLAVFQGPFKGSHPVEIIILWKGPAVMRATVQRDPGCSAAES